LSTTTGVEEAVAVSAGGCVAVVAGASVAEGVDPRVGVEAGGKDGSGVLVGVEVGGRVPPRVQPRVERTNPAAAALPLLSNWRLVNLLIASFLLQAVA